jgi:hypothetical protein
MMGGAKGVPKYVAISQRIVVGFVVNAKSLTGDTIVVDGGQHLWPRPRDIQFEVAKG